jgi:hypothetical protein
MTSATSTESPASALAALWSASLLHLPLTVATESLRFTARRLEAQADHIAMLNGCTNVPEFMEVQSQFMRKATDDYGVETGRIMEEVRAAMANKAA